MADYLDTQTGHDRVYWFTRIQRLIVKTAKPMSAKVLRKMGLSPGHSQSDSLAVFQQLALELYRALPTDRPVDSNMFLASALSIACAQWYARLQRAKACDPVRPLADRRRAYVAYLSFANELSRILVDERDDATFLPDQRWEGPFTPDATSGDFR